MIYLVDANVLSELTKATPNVKVLEWLNAHEGDFVVDPIVLGELFGGVIAMLKGRRRNQFEQWFTTLVATVDCLAWDATVGLRWASLVADLRKRGHNLPILDSMIAATALAHDLILVTRNVRDFQRTGVRIFNPFR